MPFSRYCAQSHASREHEVEEEGQVISFAVHIHVKPEPIVKKGGSPRGQQALGGNSSTLLGRRAVALAAQTIGEDSSKSWPLSPSSTCSPSSPNSACSPTTPSSTCSSPAAAAAGLGGRELQLRLVRSSFQPLGLRLAVVEEPEAWEVMSLEPGLVQHWNREHPQQQLLPGDLIMSINGEDTTIGMEAAMAADPALEMRVWRPARTTKKMSL
mmetsp:Transcript_70098/g.181738  ORF Transcript_70098/g.181738 Transcript_70098/m.181738 type:complete len:212 (+) Transcript_70098:76-711(+)